jgi:hypothetical protein
VLVFAGLLCASASAQTFCVQDPACVTAGGTPEGTGATDADIDLAVTAASTAPGLDRIELGPVTFTGAGVTWASGNPIQMMGSGEGQTTIDGTNFAITDDDTGSTVSDLSMTLDPSAVNAIALVLSGQADHVAIDGTANTSSSDGALLDDTAVLSDSTIAMATGPGTHSVGVELGGDATLEDSSVQANQAVLADDAPIGMGAATIARVRLSGTFGVSAAAGADVNVDQALIQTSGTNTAGIFVQPPTTGTAMLTAVTAFHVTDVDTGSNGTALEAGDSGTRFDSIALYDSIVRGSQFTIGFLPGSTSHSVIFSGGHNDWDTSPSRIDAGGGTFTPASDSSDVNLDPGFVSSTDLSLRFDSPLIDAATPTTTCPQMGRSATDVAGLPRCVDGNGDGTASGDIGAFEYQRSAPVVTIAPGATSAPPGVTVGFSGTATDADPGETALLTYEWSFDDGGSAPGASVAHAFAAPGMHTATLTATDPSGRTGTATTTVNVPAPGGPSGASGATGPSGPSGPTGPTGDHTRPVISSVSLSPKTIRVGTTLAKASAKRRAPTTTVIRFRLSERAKVTVAVAQVLSGRRKGSRCVAATKALIARKARRCTRYVTKTPSLTFALASGARRIAFSGRLTRTRRLAPGTYRLSLTAVDPARNHTLKARTATLRITK